MNIYKYILIALLAIASLATQAQTIVYVDAAATGFNNGTSWVNAFKELQPAIDAAFIATNGEVWIKAGTYHTTTGTDRTVRFILKDGVSLYGGFDGSETTRIQRDWVSNLTVLSGDIGVANDNSDNTNNLLTVQSTSLNNKIDGITFRDNKNDLPNQPISTINVLSGKITINNCTFFNNVGVIGSVIASLNSELKLYNSIFYNNKNSNTGSLRAAGTGNAEIVNCVFYNNNSTNSGAGATGGILGTVPLILVNNTFYNNVANGGPGALQWGGSNQILIYNNIFWGNSGTQISVPTGPTIVSNNIIDGLPVANNFIFDPQFVDVANGDFSLKLCSSAINSGDNSFLPTGITEDVTTKPRIANGTVDLGAYEYQSLPMTFTAIELGHVSCNGDANGQISVNVSGGVSPITYNVDGGSFDTNSILTGLAGGSHTVIAKDANGCEITTTETITEPADALTIAVTTTNLTCNLNNDGIASITVSGGSTPYKLYLDNTLIQTLAGNTYVQNAHDAGTYTYGIVDANGCVVAANPITITQPPVLTASLAKNNDISCNGADDGRVTVTATGGTSPYTYSLDGSNFQSSNVFENLGGGAYTAQVRDANYVALASGCDATTGSVTIIEPIVLSTSVTTTDLVCAGSQLGEIIITASGGTAPLEFSIDGSTFQSSATFSGLDGGSYSVITRDANSCNVTDNVTLTEPAAFSSGVLSANITCNGDDDGSITLSPTGGTSPYEYSIDGINFGSSGSFTSLLAGDYTATIRDANNCEYTEQITIVNPEVLSIAASFDGSEAVLSVAGGTTPYNYSVDGTSFQTSNTFVLGNGQYTFTIKDENNCVATTSQSLVITALNKLPNREQISIYPNPVTSELYFKRLGVGDEISVFDQSGRTVYAHKADNITSQLNVSYLENGVYILFVTDTKGGVSRFKFIKK